MIPNQAVDRITEISANAFRLYCYLLHCRSQETDQCNPSAATCARAIGISARYIRELRRELEDKKWVAFDNGAATILLDIEDRPRNCNSYPPEPQFLPLGTVVPTPRNYSSNAYKEEQDELTRPTNKTNLTRDGADAQPAKTKSRSKSSVKAKKTVPLAIKAIREICGRYPEKVLWDAITESLGDQFDAERLRDCYIQWIGRGYNKINYRGWLEWYLAGEIPEQGVRNNGQKHATRKNAGENFRESLEWTLS